jgi:4-hydroxy-tetrahydrodipicolinate synthase
MRRPMFSGTYTALVTPFRNDQLDETAFEALIEAQIEAGIDGIVPVGTTGESPTLDHAEHMHVIKRAVEIANKRCQVIAGTGSNATTEAVAMTEEAEKFGADAALLVAPYYNKPSQEGLYRHFSSISLATKLPIMLYSIPGRCGIEIAVETVARLASRCPTIVAIKEAGGTVDRVHALRQALPDTFDILSGDDALTLPFIASGARGVVSVASNVIPRDVVKFVRAANSGHFAEARTEHERLYPLFKDLFIEPNPVPTKYTLSLLGRMTADVRLPLCEMSEASKEKLIATLRKLHILS